jgi:hypothetical protein
MGAPGRHFRAVAGTFMLMKKRRVPLFQGSQNEPKTWHSPWIEICKRNLYLWDSDPEAAGG